MKQLLKTLLLTSIAIAPLASLNATKLTGLEFQTLDAACVSFPITTLNIKNTEAKIKKVLKTISQTSETRRNEESFIKQQLNIMLKPVEKFFAVMIQYKAIVLPLIEQSLNSKEQTPERSKATQSLLIRLCLGHANNNVRSFCEKEITSLSLLTEFCEELSQFISDFNESLSPKATKAYADFYKKLVEQVKNKKKA